MQRASKLQGAKAARLLAPLCFSLASSAQVRLGVTALVHLLTHIQPDLHQPRRPHHTDNSLDQLHQLSLNKLVLLSKSYAVLARLLHWYEHYLAQESWWRFVCCFFEPTRIALLVQRAHMLSTDALLADSKLVCEDFLTRWRDFLGCSATEDYAGSDDGSEKLLAVTRSLCAALLEAASSFSVDASYGKLDWTAVVVTALSCELAHLMNLQGLWRKSVVQLSHLFAVAARHSRRAVTLLLLTDFHEDYHQQPTSHCGADSDVALASALTLFAIDDDRVHLQQVLRMAQSRLQSTTTTTTTTPCPTGLSLLGQLLDAYLLADLIRMRTILHEADWDVAHSTALLCSAPRGSTPSPSLHSLWELLSRRLSIYY